MRVLRTGIALVHSGELIQPAWGSEAELEELADSADAVSYHFPVEIEVRGAEAIDQEALIGETLRRLAAWLEAR
jgi:hypothetical protein